MTDAPEPLVAHAMFKVLAALAELGEDTAAAVADKAGLGYSTATAKLRAWEKTGQTERVHTDSKRAVWRLTDAGHATVGTTDREPTPAGAPDTPPAQPAEAARNGELTEVADATPVPEPEPSPQDDTSADDGARADVAHTVPAPWAQATPQGETSDADMPDEATAEPEPPESTGGPTPDTDADPSTARPRRAKGSLRGALLDVLEAHPDQALKTNELCKLIDAANAGTGARKASAGAVANAADKLVIAGKAIRTDDRVATFQLAPTTP